jgi:hypothetical protein
MARWTRVFDAIGPDAGAVLQGVSLTNGFRAAAAQHLLLLVRHRDAGRYLLPHAAARA